VYQSHRRQLQHLQSGSSNRCFGQSGQAYSSRQTCTVVMNGKKVRMLLESWELLVATMVVLAFFLNLTGVSHFPPHHAGRRNGFSHNTGFAGNAITPIDDLTSHSAGLPFTGHSGIYSNVPAHRARLTSPVVPDVANRCAIERLALQSGRLQWLETSNVIISNSYQFTSENNNGSASSLGENPKINRLS